MLDGASKRNFETRSPYEAKRLMENLVSNNNTKNMDMQMIKSAVMDGDKIIEVKAEFGYVQEVSMVEQAAEKDVNHINETGFHGHIKRVDL